MYALLMHKCIKYILLCTVCIVAMDSCTVKNNKKKQLKNERPCRDIKPKKHRNKIGMVL